MKPLPPSTADRVSFKEKMALGLGAAGAQNLHTVLHNLLSPVFNVMMGVSPAHLSTLVFCQRLWDACIDPMIGRWSDGVSTCWGRRRPFLLAASVPMAVAFVGMFFFPQGIAPGWLIVHLSISSLIFYFFQSLHTVPLAALQLEVTRDYHERTRVASVAGICVFAVSLSTFWVLPLVTSGWLGTPAESLRLVICACAVLYAGLALLPFFWSHERHAEAALARQKAALRVALGEALREPDFVRLIGMRVLATFGTSVVSILGFYCNVYLVHRGDLKTAAPVQGLLGTIYVIGGVASYAAIRVAAIRWGKIRALQVSASVLIVGALAKLVVYVPGHPYWQLVVPLCNGIANAGLMLVTTSMLADVIDSDELAYGGRREGLFSSVLGWLDKVGNSCGMLLSGYLLVLIGFDATLPAQSPATLRALQLAYAGFPLIGACAVIVLSRRYTLDEKSGQAINRKLADKSQVTKH